MNFHRRILHLLIFALVISCPPAVLAASDDLSAIASFPANCTEISRIDLAQARQFPWFVALRTKFVPVQFYRFENFISSPQMGLGNSVNSVYWSTVPADAISAGGTLGIAVGEFDRQTAESQLNSTKSPAIEFAGFTLYATASDFGAADLWVTFIDSSTIAFGSRPVLESMIRVRDGRAPSLQENSELMSLVRRQKTDGIFWSAFSGSAARAALRRLVPAGAGANASAPQSGEAIASISSLVISAEGSSDSQLDLSAMATAATPQDAALLSALFQAGVMWKQYQAGQSDSAISKILGNLEFNSSGNTITVSLSMKTSEAARLIQRDDLWLPAM